MATRLPKKKLMNITTTNQKDYTWKAEWNQGGSRKRRFFKTEKSARDFGRAMAASLDMTPRGEPPPSTDEMRAVYHARAKAVPLMAAVESWLRGNGRAQGKTLRDLVEARIMAMAADTIGDEHKQTTQRWLRRLPATMLEQAASEVDATMLMAAVVAGGAAPVTQQHRRAMLTAVFNQAVRDGVLATNPASVIKTHRRRAATPPGIFAPDEAAMYLDAAREHSPGMLAANAIGLYAGLRLSEIRRLDWSRVLVERGFIEVTAGTAKTKSRRIVDMQPCLALILGPLVAAGPVCPVGHVHLERVLRKKLPFRVPPNAARHSFVSYHLALFGDVAKTELQAGHDRAILFAHYRELVSKADAEKYFQASLV